MNLDRHLHEKHVLSLWYPFPQVKLLKVKSTILQVLRQSFLVSPNANLNISPYEYKVEMHANGPSYKQNFWALSRSVMRSIVARDAWPQLSHRNCFYSVENHERKKVRTRHNYLFLISCIHWLQELLFLLWTIQKETLCSKSQRLHWNQECINHSWPLKK